jgi:hypothetical protein
LLLSVIDSGLFEPADKGSFLSAEGQTFSLGVTISDELSKECQVLRQTFSLAVATLNKLL